MGFLDWLVKAALKSDDKFINDMRKENSHRWSQNNAQERYNASINCCANCLWFERLAAGGRLNCCTKHDFCYNLEDVKYRQIEYTRTCDDFYKK